MENITSTKLTGVTEFEVICTKDVVDMQSKDTSELNNFVVFKEGEKYPVKRVGNTFAAKSDTVSYIIGKDLQNIEAPFTLVQ